MLTLQGVTYTHPNQDVLFSDLNLLIPKSQKAALIGNNGVGKSTLLKIATGNLLPTSGAVKRDSKLYYVPQIFGQYHNYSIAKALGIADALRAFYAILAGEITDENLTILNEDWTIEERCQEALAAWELDGLDLFQEMATLSGGQQTRVFLAGIAMHQPELVLMDEPTNHLDWWSRDKLYHYLQTTRQTLLIVSHDSTLLNLMDHVYELQANGITAYGGNYGFYLEQKMLADEALSQEVKNKEKLLRKAKEVERESIARQQKLDARGKRKQEKAGLSTIMMNTLKNNAEKSTSKMKGVHAEKLSHISKALTQLRAALPDRDQMKIDFEHSALPKGKTLLMAKGINFSFKEQLLWPQDLNFELRSGDRYVLEGKNGTGKTTLIQLMLGELEPKVGIIHRADLQYLYIDQDYGLINNSLTVYEQAQQFNTGALQEHAIKMRLSRFLFTKESWDKPCRALSGGEKMRLMLCALTIGNSTPDLMILDEPTNNLDMKNLEILTDAIAAYQGTLVVVSHDTYFLEQLGIKQKIVLF